MKIWLKQVLMHSREFKTRVIRVYLAADVGDDVLLGLQGEYAGDSVGFVRVPKEAPVDFADFWNPVHYGWKTWVWRHLVSDSVLAGHVVFYSDSGAAMVRLPFAAAAVALESGVCVYEDHNQLNKYWCSARFCETLSVTAGEKELPQAFAGAITFRAGAESARRLFEAIWAAAQDRGVLAGPKWEGVTAGGQHYGHRHDQSILSILARRHGCKWRALDLDYCDESLRRTFMIGGCYYFHRGGFKVNENFSPLIADAYVINLERRADRLQKFRENHPKIAKKVRTWKAVDGRALTLTPHIARMFRPNDFFWKKSVMGCALSHLGVWSQLAREPGDGSLAYLVLEDDARLAADAEMKLMVNTPKAPADYDVLYLGGVLPPNKAGFEGLKEQVAAGSPWYRVAANQMFGQRSPTRYFHFCAYAYVLSQRGARKLMDLVQRRDGYYTSADHMMCNQVEGQCDAGKEFNLYFMNPTPAGCTQEDDPRYSAANFNDFSRIDAFDSDLWTNDERFGEGEVRAALASGAPLDVPMTVLESRGVVTAAPVAAPVAAPAAPTVPVAAPAAPVAAPTVPVVAPAKPTEAKPTEAKPRFYTFEDEYSTMELDWLAEIFGQPIKAAPVKTIGFGSKLDHTPICIVQKPHMDFWQGLFSVWSAFKQDFYAIHISDEYAANQDPIAWYRLPNCKGVIRNYVRPDIPQDVANKVQVIPLGYATGRAGKSTVVPASSRPLAWSFEGTDWHGRRAALEPLVDLGLSHKLTFRGDWAGAAYDSTEYCALLNSTKIVPVVAGNNVETFRMWEAIEHGCIPLYVRQPGDDLYWAMISAKLPVFAANSWAEAAEAVKMLLGNGAVLDMYQQDMVEKWVAWKSEIKAGVRAWLCGA